MRHNFIDTYAYLNSHIHKMPIKIKIIAVLILLLLIVLSPAQLWFMLIYSAVVSLSIYLSRIPLGFIFIRIMETLPIILFLSLLSFFRDNGHIVFLFNFSRALLAVALIMVLTATTKFSDLLSGLKNLGLPHLFIMLLSFMYRYVFLLEDQFLRTRRAYQSRATMSMGKLIHFRTLSNIVGVLFIRTYERAERIYLAMCARGFDIEKSN